MKNKYLITTPIYYLNGDPHVGHAYCTFASEIYARWLRSCGEEVLFSTGTDCHGAKVSETAKKLGKNPKEHVIELNEIWKKYWEDLNIEYDDFITTIEERHKNTVYEVIERTKKNNNHNIYKSKYSGLYCVGCEKFLFAQDLVNGKCPDHDREPEVLEENNHFFKLSAYEKSLQHYLTEKNKVIPEYRLNESLGFIKEGLEDFCITRERVDWGIRWPDSNEIIYVWYDALINYVTVAGGPEKWQEYKVIHFLGKEINRFHTLYWPAMLEASELNKPHKFLITGFLNASDGRKMSKSLGNSINPVELVKKYGRDAFVFYVFSEFSLGQDGNFSEEDMAIKRKTVLANDWGNLISRATTLANKVENWYSGRLDEEIQIKCEDVSQEFAENMTNMDYKKAIQSVWKLTKIANEYIEKNEPWKNKENSKDVVKTSIELVRIIAGLMSPFLKESEKFVKDSLGVDDLVSPWGDVDVKNVSKLGVLYNEIV